MLPDIGCVLCPGLLTNQQVFMKCLLLLSCYPRNMMWQYCREGSRCMQRETLDRNMFLFKLRTGSLGKGMFPSRPDVQGGSSYITIKTFQLEGCAYDKALRGKSWNMREVPG